MNTLKITSGLAAIAALLISAGGCGKSGVGRIEVRGVVTYNGQPVPAGQVRFEPNASKGGSGPVGFARIVDGEYDTRNQGKGPVSGPMRVIVTGVTSSKAFAPELFPRYRTEIDVSGDSREFDIEVPSAKRG